MTSSASKPSAVTTGIASAAEHFLDQADLALERFGRGQPIGLVLGERVGAEAMPGDVEGDRDVARLLVAQQIDEHRGEAVDRVGRLAGGGGEVLDRQGIERAIRDRVTVDQHEPGAAAVGPGDARRLSAEERVTLRS